MVRLVSCSAPHPSGTFGGHAVTRLRRVCRARHAADNLLQVVSQRPSCPSHPFLRVTPRRRSLSGSSPSCPSHPFLRVTPRRRSRFALARRTSEALRRRARTAPPRACVSVCARRPNKRPPACAGGRLTAVTSRSRPIDQSNHL